MSCFFQFISLDAFAAGLFDLSEKLSPYFFSKHKLSGESKMEQIRNFMLKIRPPGKIVAIFRAELPGETTIQTV
jgi:hypothetical protein